MYILFISYIEQLKPHCPAIQQLSSKKTEKLLPRKQIDKIVKIDKFSTVLHSYYNQPTTLRNITQIRFRKITFCELKIRVSIKQNWDCNISTLLRSHHQTEWIQKQA